MQLSRSLVERDEAEAEVGTAGGAGKEGGREGRTNSLV